MIRLHKVGLEWIRLALTGSEKVIKPDIKEWQDMTLRNMERDGTEQGQGYERIRIRCTRLLPTNPFYSTDLYSAIITRHQSIVVMTRENSASLGKPDVNPMCKENQKWGCIG